jgi:tetratricopeptide (TPR) repeat protein
MTNNSRVISDEFLAQVKDALVCRRVGEGMDLLELHRPLLTSFDPQEKNSAQFVSYLAHWVDVGFQATEPVKELVARFSKTVSASLPLRDYLYLRMARGMVAMAEESKEEAIQHFDFVLNLDQEADEKELLAVASFCKGRCLRMKGEYDQALASAVKGRMLALELGHQCMAAVMQVLESWLLFQRGDVKQAVDFLQEAEGILSHTDDYLTLGNIHSSYGRIAQRAGRYQHAIESFSEAIRQYKKRDPTHRNVARSLNNMAHVKRLIALHLRRKIDDDAARRRRAAARGHASEAKGKVHYRDRFEQLQEEALAELGEAAAIYERHENYHGLGSVHLNYGHLYLDNGDLQHAEARATTALQLAETKRDHILMARAQLLRCMIENSHVEEEIGESTEPGSHARLAQDCIRQAIEWAKQMQNRRLLAHCYIWQGLTNCNPFFDDQESARHSYDQALSLSKGEYADGVWADLQALKTRVLRGSSVNANLRAWSQGSIGNKTFREISEEFAELITVKVWEREDRKVSRVAARLSMSPKRIREILDRVGRRKKTADS